MASRRALFLGSIAFGLWGLLPLYWSLLAAVPADEILAHRVTWSFISLLIFVRCTGRTPGVVTHIKWNRSVVAAIACSAVLIGSNWLTFIWATNAGYLLECSLGYYIAPLVALVLGMVVLGEQMAAMQWLAVGLAAIGVVWIVVDYGALPWVALYLAFSFTTYGLLRKLAPLPPLSGLLIETAILTPFSIGYLAYLSLQNFDRAFSAGAGTFLLLMLSGVATTIPLLCYIGAAKELSFVTLGLLQYISPTIQFLLAALLFGEQVSSVYMTAFVLIWGALFLYTIDGLRRFSRSRQSEGEAKFS